MLLPAFTRMARASIIAIWLGAAGYAPAADTIVVGGEDGYEPYETLNADGEPVGFNIDLMRAIGKATDSEVEFRLGSWETMRQALQSGEIDVLGMFVSDRREASVDFARPHVIVHHRIFIPAGAEPINRIEDLAGRSVIVQREAWSHEFLRQSDQEMALTLVDSDSEGLALLSRGGHDAALLTEHRSRHTMRENRLDNLTVSGPPVLPVEYALAVREGNQALLAQINVGLERVMASGAFDRIYARWLQPLDGNEREPGGYGVAISAIIAVVVLAVFAWLLWKLLAYRRDMRQAQQQIAYLREHDALTGLLSRHALEQRLDKLCEVDSDKRHSLLEINVDQFRVINETVGHAAADRLLRSLGTRLQELFPADALIARQGADEYAVLMPETDEARAAELGRELLDSLDENPLAPQRGAGSLTLSVGVVSFDHRDGGIARILRRADCACLAAKDDGGNRVHVWQPDDARLAEKFGELGWVARIQQALAEDRMTLYWQPISPTSGPPFRTVAVEILVRMLPEVDGEAPITAAEFMPAAERYFMTTQIDRWVVSTTLEWMTAHRDSIDRLDRVNINLSGRSLGDQRFLDFLDRILRRHVGLLPRLCLEVTETALISNLEQVSRLFQRLNRGGCRIALDDFGTGVSSMNYLRQLPVDYLKVDGSFVRDIDRDPSALEFIAEINRLGQSMGKITVAECVETESVQGCLKSVGFDLMQGYLVGHPAPLDELIVHLTRPLRVANIP
ncbi:EAL domain-containing protein [Wenzhouxiangella sp. EGI_FJ10409]|uniref:EAL domain-containing protein n=1 Tax=Wenzhouxiangella sp. EGI_FJ10409 TaxID=3243767 RepID=UPI0035D89E20